jgi:hypothetical protein
VEATAYLWSDKKPGNTNTTTQQLTSALPHFSEAALPEMAAEAPQSLPEDRYKIPSCGERLTTLKIINIPTGKSDIHGPYTPDEIHDALKAENIHYAGLAITQPPTWVREDPTTYLPGSKSSVTFTFKDLEACNSWFLLRQLWLHAFGRYMEVRELKGKYKWVNGKWISTISGRQPRKKRQYTSLIDP